MSHRCSFQGTLSPMISYLFIPGRLRTLFLQVHIAKDLRPERSHSIAPKAPGTRPEAGLSLACSFPAACSSRFLGRRDQTRTSRGSHRPLDPRQGGTFLDAANLVAVCVNHHIAIVCCRACESTPIIRILASFDPSAAHFVAPASSRPWMAQET